MTANQCKSASGRAFAIKVKALQSNAKLLNHAPSPSNRIFTAFLLLGSRNRRINVASIAEAKH
jgi:hypothetical protein